MNEYIMDSVSVRAGVVATVQDTSYYTLPFISPTKTGIRNLFIVEKPELVEALILSYEKKLVNGDSIFVVNKVEPFQKKKSKNPLAQMSFSTEQIQANDDDILPGGMPGCEYFQYTVHVWYDDCCYSPPCVCYTSYLVSGNACYDDGEYTYEIDWQPQNADDSQYEFPDYGGGNAPPTTPIELAEKEDDYNQCYGGGIGQNCWLLCGYGFCTDDDEGLYLLKQKIPNITNAQVSCLKNQSNQILRYLDGANANINYVNNFISIACGNSNASFEEYMYEMIAQEVADRLDLSPQLEECLNPFQIIQINNYIGYGHDAAKNEFAKSFVEITCEIPNANFDRYRELIDKLKIEPDFLIKDCAQQEGLNIQDYEYLYDFELPQSTKTKLNNLGPDFKHQQIEDGNVAYTNIDYYGVELTTLPDVNGNGQQDETAQEVFETFRLQFGELASGRKDNFNPNCSPFNTNVWWNFEYYGAPYDPIRNYDEENWTDLNLDGTPLNTIFFIDAGADDPLPNKIADKGAIIISEYDSNSHFIGSTITTEKSGSQPFSGNRQWGYKINNNGNMEIYTKAIDVAHLTDPMRVASWIADECAMNDYYNLAKETWKNLQNEVEDWVEQNGNNGQATIVTPKQAGIPNEKVEELLTQNNSIPENINCE